MRTLASLAALTALTACSGASAPPTDAVAGELIPTTDEPQFLDFLVSPPGLYDQTGPGAGDPAAVRSRLDASVAGLAARIGATGDGHSRQLGFVLVLSPWTVEAQFPGKLATVIAQAAQVALARHVALHISIESHYFWQNRPDLWNFWDPAGPGYDPANVANVEWSDWARTGYRWRFVDWGVPMDLGAPHMCYLSAAIQREVARLGSVVGVATRAAMDALATAGHPEFFSGVTVGSEPSLDNYAVVDSFDPAMAALMAATGAPKVRLGYCAFTALGYSAASPPRDLAAAAATANQRFIAAWAHALAGAGVPARRLYTHVAGSADGTPVAAFVNAPIANAFVLDARPGWTSYPWGPLTTTFAPLTDAVAAHGGGHWGGTEAAPFDGTRAVEPYGYLARHYAAGATVVVMNTGASGGLGGALEDAVYGPSAIVAYQRFLTQR